MQALAGYEVARPAWILLQRALPHKPKGSLAQLVEIFGDRRGGGPGGGKGLEG